MFCFIFSSDFLTNSSILMLLIRIISILLGRNEIEESAGFVLFSFSFLILTIGALSYKKVTIHLGNIWMLPSVIK